MKNVLIVILLMVLPFLGLCQQKTTAKKDNSKTNAPAKPTKDIAGLSTCIDFAEGLHLMVSGMDYDVEEVTDASGNATFRNVPAGDKVITKTGQDKSSPTCKFSLTCQGAAGKSYTKTGSFDQLIKGVSFRMVQAGDVIFSVK